MQPSRRSVRERKTKMRMRWSPPAAPARTCPWRRFLRPSRRWSPKRRPTSRPTSARHQTRWVTSFTLQTLRRVFTLLCQNTRCFLNSLQFVSYCKASSRFSGSLPTPCCPFLKMLISSVWLLFLLRLPIPSDATASAAKCRGTCSTWIGRHSQL